MANKTNEVEEQKVEEVKPEVAPAAAAEEKPKRPPTIEENELADHRRSAAFKADDEHKVKDSGAAHQNNAAKPVDQN